MAAKQELAVAEERAKYGKGLMKTQQGLTDYGQDFFGKPTFLTVSGQLNAEIYATALSDVYTFGECVWDDSTRLDTWQLFACCMDGLSMDAVHALVSSFDSLL